MLASACFPGTILGSWQVIQKPKIPLGQSKLFKHFHLVKTLLLSCQRKKEKKRKDDSMIRLLLIFYLLLKNNYSF
jgi:hypothetical protein